jgi:hypothetical protein
VLDIDHGLHPSASVLEQDERVPGHVRHRLPQDLLRPRQLIVQPHRPLAGRGFNTVFWVVEKQEQLPVEFATSAQTVRVITIPKAPADQRLAAARHVVQTVLRMQGALRLDAAVVAPAAENLLSVTHGMSNSEVIAVGRVAIDRGIAVNQLDEATRLYHIGVRDNPWAASSVREKILAGERMLTGSTDESGPIGVLGQERAVRKAVEIFMRSAAGLTGAQSSSSRTGHAACSSWRAPPVSGRPNSPRVSLG